MAGGVKGAPGRPAETDIVVMAEGLLRGANVTTFWVLRPTKRGYEILVAAPAHDLSIKRTRANGYKDIELFSATAVSTSIMTLRWDGHQYKEHTRTSKAPR